MIPTDILLLALMAILLCMHATLRRIEDKLDRFMAATTIRTEEVL